MRVKISPMSAHDLRDLSRLCDQELTLDRSAGMIPRIVTRRPHLGLVARHGSAMAGACVASVAESDDGTAEGFIDLLVVDRAEQRRGIGRQLGAEMERALAGRGCQQVTLAGHGPYYAWPGVDIHYTAAVCFAEDSGYQRHGCEVNMDVDLTNVPLDTDGDETRLAAEGIQVRRASADDDGPMQQSLSSTWQAGWVAEITAILRSSEAGLYVAVRGDRYIGFCGYGLNRIHEVGPVGTHPDLRRLGIGAVLIKRCLAEQRGRGVVAAELVWAGPLSYFARTVHATIGRAFWLYTKDLAATSRAPDWRDRIGLI
jgi:mycothiol synthase